jgi:hypothetical protein
MFAAGRIWAHDRGWIWQLTFRCAQHLAADNAADNFCKDMDNLLRHTKHMHISSLVQYVKLCAKALHSITCFTFLTGHSSEQQRNLTLNHISIDAAPISFARVLLLICACCMLQSAVPEQPFRICRCDPL